MSFKIFKGESGEAAERGSPGLPGPKGEVGERGYRGEKGEKGDMGLPGNAIYPTDYESRSQRIRIVLTFSPFNCEIGVQGEGGLRGPPGADGNDGEVGAQGPPGLPVRVKNPPKKEEKEWPC